MNAKEQFIKIYNENIKREGAQKFLDYLLTTDFFDSPASTRFHNNFAGGLVDHSIKVYQRFVKMLESEYGKDPKKWPVTMESVAVIALLHDVCKIGCYKVEERNVKVGNEWVKKPYYAYEDPLPYGHGEKSVYVISGFMKLTRDEAMVINWHMGAYDARHSPNSFTLSNVYEKFPLAVIFHTADLLTSYLDEKTVK